jgi:hypothetical protein
MDHRMSAATQARQIRKDAQDHFERTRLCDLIKPTRETEAKLRPDPLEWLHAKQHIGDAERDAGLEIRAVYAAICGAVMSRSGFPTDRQPGRSGGMSSWIAQLYTDHWKPWADELADQRPMLEITIDALIDEHSFNSIDRRYHWKNGKAQELVVEALELYAVLTNRGRQ